MNNTYFVYILIVFLLLIIYNLFNREGFLSYSSLNNNDPVYLFWTGGYDSTFRLCQIVIKEKLKVQPIYLIGDNLDNYSYKKTSKRKNVNQELQAMNKIKQKLFNNYPFTRNLILPTKIIRNINISKSVSSGMMDLYKKGLISRPVTQYGSLSQVTFDLKKNIEVCSERCGGSIMCRLLYGKQYCSGKSVYKKNYNIPNIFKKFVFPISSYTKEDMLIESKKYGYNNILYLTWSCWFPKNGHPCKNCPMCKERIIN